ncbi:MAG: protein of unknown function DitE, partial [Bryobacterales bacterium]|nr:protein of unknown function DitE [Bryobacterales bacterium]
FVGQCLSVSGTWAQRVAQAWLAYSLTHSSFYLGLVTFAASAPAFLLTPLAGVLADRVDRRRMLLWTQIFAMLQAAALAIAAIKGFITPNWLLWLATVQGIVTAFDNPARQAFYSEMVQPEDLSNAIALNASLVNVARVVGPAGAGALVAIWGEGICFGVNAASFLAVIVALLMMKIAPVKRRASSVGRWEAVQEGIAFVRGKPALRLMLLNFSVFNLAGSPYLTLLPIQAARLQGGPAALGWLVSASGIGAIVCSLVLASRATTSGLPMASFVASIVAGLALIVLGYSQNFVLSLLTVMVIGGGYVLTLAATQTVLQTSVGELMRGRVMSFYSVVFLGIPPVGSLIAGMAAERFQSPVTLASGGLICVLGALYCAFDRKGRVVSYAQVS